MAPNPPLRWWRRHGKKPGKRGMGSGELRGLCRVAGGDGFISQKRELPMRLTYKTTAPLSHHPQVFALTRQMEAKDADGSHQDICRFMVTACLIGDKASLPVGPGRGRAGSASQRSSSHQSHALPFFFFNQLVPITANRTRSVALIIIPAGRHQSHFCGC